MNGERHVDGRLWRASKRAAPLLVIGVAAAAALSVGGEAVPRSVTASAATPVYVTLLFSRTAISAADDCRQVDAGVARLDTVVAPWLTSLAMTGTGTLTTDRTQASARTCVHSRSTLAASWADAKALSTTRGWAFTSHTATYPPSLATLTAERSYAETCGSAQTLDAQGLRGGHGMISYPGAQPVPTTLQASYASHCFAWGRQYSKTGVTTSAAARTAPYWQYTKAVNGGACNVSSQPCYTIPSVGNPRYNLPSSVVQIVNGLQPGQWFTLQAYLLVRGASPTYTTNTTKWDCRSSDPRLHWTNDNERYCYVDWQRIVRALKARGDVVVTDPLTVGTAFGRPAGTP